MRAAVETEQRTETNVGDEELDTQRQPRVLEEVVDRRLEARVRVSVLRRHGELEQRFGCDVRNQRNTVDDALAEPYTVRRGAVQVHDIALFWVLLEYSVELGVVRRVVRDFDANHATHPAVFLLIGVWAAVAVMG